MRHYLILLILFSLGLFEPLSGQSSTSIIKDPSFLMSIPEIKAMDASPAHLYILSEKDGLVVFRTNTDSLTWLYSSEGMHKRGEIISADIRFAYIYGGKKRLTVIEPTSMLGVYSSTSLPTPAKDVARIEKGLYLALDSLGLGMLSLDSPSSVDSSLVFQATEQFENRNVIQVEASRQQLFALSSDATLILFNKSDDGISFRRTVPLRENIRSLFVRNDELVGATENGNLYLIGSNGNLTSIMEVEQPVDEVYSWSGNWVVRTERGEIWIKKADSDSNPVKWKQDLKAGNLLAFSAPELFFNEYDKVHRLLDTGVTPAESASGSISSIPSLSLKEIENITLPFPQPLLVPIVLENEIDSRNVQFSVRSNLENIKVQGFGLYWQPSYTDIGRHQITVIASTTDNQTDSTSFVVDIRSFNTPPRISPVQPMKIAYDEKFTLPIRAFDPDGMNRKLLRYMGVDLPSGATINEQTGELSWTPTIRQVGEHTLQVIVTDQYGAAASKDIKLTVIEEKRQ